MAPTEISIVYVYTNMLANGIFATTPCNRNERAPSILNMQLINATLPFLLLLLKNQRNLYLVIFLWKIKNFKQPNSCISSQNNNVFSLRLVLSSLITFINHRPLHGNCSAHVFFARQNDIVFVNN